MNPPFFTGKKQPPKEVSHIPVLELLRNVDSASCLKSPPRAACTSRRMALRAFWGGNMGTISAAMVRSLGLSWEKWWRIGMSLGNTVRSFGCLGQHGDALGFSWEKWWDVSSLGHTVGYSQESASKLSMNYYILVFFTYGWTGEGLEHSSKYCCRNIGL